MQRTEQTEHTTAQETRLLVFDTETTGLRRDHDQVIELAVQAGLTATAPRHTWRFRPSVAIDPEAQAVHGISMDDLASERPFSAYAARLHRMFSAADVLVGYNVGFDLDMLQAEFARVGLPPVDLDGKRIVDAYRLWAAVEPRKLAHAHKRFVGTDMVGAHRAGADVAATAAVLGGMLAAFGLQGVSWEDLPERCGPIGRSRHIEERQGMPVLAFGKHAGKPLHEIAAGPDRGYLEWMARGDFPEGVKRVCRAALVLTGQALSRTRDHMTLYDNTYTAGRNSSVRQVRRRQGPGNVSPALIVPLAEDISSSPAIFMISC